MRKIALLALTIALLPPLAAFGASYSDMDESHWAYSAVSAMSDAGVIVGYPDGSFLPSETVTYGEFIKMAYLASGGTEPGAAAAGEDWALPYYEASEAAGLFTAYDIGKSALSYAIPRGLMALILSNIIGDVEIENYSAIQNGISDVTAATKNEFHITKVYANNLITGYPDGTFKPDGTLSRAEAATVIWRLKSSGVTQKPVETPAEEKPVTEEPENPVDSGDTRTLMEKIEEYAAENSSVPIQEAINESNFTKPISDVVDGPVTYIDHPVLYYEILEGYSYKMKRVPNLMGDEMIAMGYRGARGLLIKDRKVIARLGGGRADGGAGDPCASIDGYDEEGYQYNMDNYTKTYKGIFPDFDYIAVVTTDDYNVGSALLIPNTL